MTNREVQFASNPEHYVEREKLYAAVRQKEGRLLGDGIVQQLPEAPPAYPHAREWQMRRRTLLRFNSYLAEKTLEPLKILDLGCGNGWMANRLAENPLWDVTAVDLNQVELAQGARLFGRKNLHFIYADLIALKNLSLLQDNSLPTSFDIILMAASVQYFPNLRQLFSVLHGLLKPQGEIHLIDSPFYTNEKARTAARWRTLDYYKKVGVPEMSAHYHHHLWPEVQALGGENLNSGLRTKFLQKIGQLAPFPWVRVRT